MVLCTRTVPWLLLFIGLISFKTKSRRTFKTYPTATIHTMLVHSYLQCETDSKCDKPGYSAWHLTIQIVAQCQRIIPQIGLPTVVKGRYNLETRKSTEDYRH